MRKIVATFITSILIFLLFFNSCTNDHNTGWEEIETEIPSDWLVSSVDFFNSDLGMVTASFRGNSAIYVTNDAGKSWQNVFEGNYGFHDIEMVSEETAVAVGNAGIWKSINTGQNWRSVDIETSEPLMAVDFSDEQNGLVVGRNGTIIHTENGGKAWTLQQSGSSSFLKDVNYSGSDIAYAVGSGGTILKTENAGHNWSSQPINYSSNLSAISFFDHKIGVAVGGEGTILLTNDGGSTWSKQKPINGNGLLGVDMSDKSGVIVGFDGTIISTTDEGKTWELKESGSFPHLYNIVMINSEESIAVGDKGTILKNF